MPSPQDFFDEVSDVRKDVLAVLARLDKLEEEANRYADRSERAEAKRILALEKDVRELEKRRANAQERHLRQIQAFESEIAKLRLKVSNGEPDVDRMPNAIIEKARTIAIFDTILNGITLWNTEGDVASDVEMAAQSILFPAVYERVMRADDPAYLLEDVPFSASVVVQRGREMVKWIRSECESSITEESAWNKYAPEIVDWWRNDALPLIYGERDEAWSTDVPYSLNQMFTWKNNPADRMVEFPEVYDAMDLLRKTRSEIIPGTQIPAFSSQIAATRLTY